MMKMLSLIFIFIFCLSFNSFALFTFVSDVESHGNQISQGILRAGEAMRALEQTIRLYEKSVQQYQKLQEMSVNDLTRNGYLNSLRNFKGDPASIRGVLGKTRSLLEKSVPYESTSRHPDKYGSKDTSYQAPDDIVVVQEAVDKMGKVLGTVDRTTHLMKTPTPTKIYDYYDKLKTSYMEYNDLIGKNVSLKQELASQMDEVVKKIDNATTESENEKYQAEYDILNRRVSLLQDEESVSWRNLQALEAQRKIYENEKNTAGVKRANLVEDDYFKKAKSMTQKEVLTKFKESEKNGMRWF